MLSCGTHIVNTSIALCGGNTFRSNTSLALAWGAGWNGSGVAGGGWNGSGRSGNVATQYSVDVTTIIELYVISLLILVGVVGNCLSVVVLRKDKERKDALFLLQALAIADLLYLAAAALRYPLKHMLPTHDQYVDMQPTVFPLLKTFQTITIWMMVLVAVDRFECVCRSLEASGVFNRTTRRRYAAAVFVAGFIYNIPRFFDSHVCGWYEPCTGRMLSHMLYRQEFANIYYWNIYLDGMYLVLLYMAPLTALGFFNFKLIQAIRYSSKRRYRMNSRFSSTTRTHWSSEGAALPRPPLPHGPGSATAALTTGSGAMGGPGTGVSGSDKNATMVLVTIVLVFIVCESPELIIKLVSFTERNFAPSTETSSTSSGSSSSSSSSGGGVGVSTTQLLRFNVVSELLMVINSTVNFIVYLVFGRRFRRILRETFRISFRRLTGAGSTSTTTPDDPAAASRHHHNCIHATAAASARLHRAL